MSGTSRRFAASDGDQFRADRASGYNLLTPGIVTGHIGEGTLNLPADYEMVRPLTNAPLKFTCTGPHMLARMLTNRFYRDLADLATDIAKVLRGQLEYPKIGLGIGVIDIKDNEVESPDLVASRIETILKAVGEKRLQYVHPDCGVLDAATQCGRSQTADVSGRARSAGRTFVAMSGPRPLVDEKAAVRAVVFGHLAGIAVAPVMKALLDRGVFDLFRGDSHWVEFDRILEHSRGNHGHLRVALRLLSSYGWLRTEVDRGAPLYSVTPGGVIAARKASHLYGAVVPFLRLAIFLDDFLFGHGEGSLLPYLESLVPQALGRWGLQVEEDAASAPVWEQIRTQLDGVLIGPAMVALERGGAFDSSSMVLGPWRASQVILPACLCFSTFSAFLAG